MDPLIFLALTVKSLPVNIFINQLKINFCLIYNLHSLPLMAPTRNMDSVMLHFVCYISQAPPKSKWEGRESARYGSTTSPI